MKQKLFSLMMVVVFATISIIASSQAARPNDGAAGKKGSFDITAARNAIDASNQQFGKIMATGDSAGLVAMYHSAAKVYPPNMPEGSRTVMGGLAKMLPGMGIKAVTLRSTDVEGDENMLVESGTYEMSDGTNAVDKGKYIVVWKKENGSWKMYRDIWNSDMPPSAGGH